MDPFILCEFLSRATLIGLPLQHLSHEAEERLSLRFYQEGVFALFERSRIFQERLYTKIAWHLDSERIEALRPRDRSETERHWRKICSSNCPGRGDPAAGGQEG